MATPLGRLHLLTDCRPGRDPVGVVRAALSAGVPVVQVRVPDEWTDRAAYALAGMSSPTITATATAALLASLRPSIEPISRGDPISGATAGSTAPGFDCS